MNLIAELHNLGLLDDLEFHVCSVGARDAGYDDLEAGWLQLGSHLHIYGFEPDPEACEHLNRKFRAQNRAHSERYIAKALSDAPGPETLHITEYPDCSSLYLPNQEICQRFSAIPSDHPDRKIRFLTIGKLLQLAKTEESQCSTLDKELDGVNIDFLKIDTQGAELKILQGGKERILPQVLVAQVEVEFASLYVGQPLFADIDIYLRAQGFTLLNIDPSYRIRSFAPLVDPRQAPLNGQLLWGDAFYYRDLLSYPDDSPLKTPENLLKLVCILYLIHPLRHIDICAEYLLYLATYFGNLDNNKYFDLEPLIVDMLASCDLLGLSPEEIEQLPVMQALRQAKALSQELHAH